MKRSVTLAVAFVLAGVFLFFAVRGVNWHDVASVMQRARPDALAIACCWASAAMFLRSVRWRVLLMAERDVPVPTVFWATAVGYLGNQFLPARLGEIMRAAAIAWKTGASKAFVLATALTERMLDAAVLVLISSAALLTLSTLPEWSARSARLMAVASSAGVAGIVLLPRLEAIIHRGLSLLRLPPAVHDRSGELLAHFLLGMRVFHHFGRAMRFLTLTAVIWSVDGMAALSVSRSLDLDLSFTQLLLLIAALGLASAIPSTPGYIGVYQFVAVSVLAPFGISQHNALAYIFLFQGVTSGCVLVWGLLGLWRLRSEGVTVSAPLPDYRTAGEVG
jgi:glycosyltransferase 2 family protein